MVGWGKAGWRAPVFSMPAGMQIDFGGIGKEYAVDRAAEIGSAAGGAPVLVNFGGDIRVTGPRRDGRPWHIAIENVVPDSVPPLVEVRRGAVTTSGDSRRYLLKDGVRYGHILTAQRLAGAGCAAFSDRARSELHPGGAAVHTGDAAGRRRGELLAELNVKHWVVVTRRFAGRSRRLVQCGLVKREDYFMRVRVEELNDPRRDARQQRLEVINFFGGGARRKVELQMLVIDSQRNDLGDVHRASPSANSRGFSYTLTHGQLTIHS
jgi:hypothetical protein